jgi:dolichol-phosphate mannosyltransferase
MATRYLTALPVYNEVNHVGLVLDEVLRYSSDVLVVDDGSTDGSGDLLAARNDVIHLRHEKNQGYGAALRTAFQYALREKYEVLVTIDCDGQHEPQRIPEFVAASSQADIVSGSRYLQIFDDQSVPPEDRRRINMQITQVINERFNLKLTDAFCGFKAYRCSALSALEIHETGYAMPLEVWVQASRAGLSIIELPVPLIYLDENRSFGGSLDNAATRLNYYNQILDRAVEEANAHPPHVRKDLCRGTSG